MLVYQRVYDVKNRVLDAEKSQKRITMKNHSSWNPSVLHYHFKKGMLVVSRLSRPASLTFLPPAVLAVLAEEAAL